MYMYTNLTVEEDVLNNTRTLAYLSSFREQVNKLLISQLSTRLIFAICFAVVLGFLFFVLEMIQVNQ